MFIIKLYKAPLFETFSVERGAGIQKDNFFLFLLSKNTTITVVFIGNTLLFEIM